MMAQVSYDPPTTLPDAALLMASAQRLAGIPEASDREQVIATLFKLIDGILASPEEPKKRRVKKSNETFHNKVGRFAAAVEFLKASGFVDGDDPDAEVEPDSGGGSPGSSEWSGGGRRGAALPLWTHFSLVTTPLRCAFGPHRLICSPGPWEPQHRVRCIAPHMYHRSSSESLPGLACHAEAIAGMHCAVQRSTLGQRASPSWARIFIQQGGSTPWQHGLSRGASEEARLPLDARLMAMLPVMLWRPFSLDLPTGSDTIPRAMPGGTRC